MALWILLIIVFVAGIVGGIVNALISDNGFFLPQTVQSGGAKIMRPGFLGNALIGGVAACVSWGLYGPFAAFYLAGGPTMSTAGTSPVGLTLSSLVGGILVGVGGARVLSNEVDKTLLRGAASAAQSSPANETKSTRIAFATPADALKIAQS